MKKEFTFTVKGHHISIINSWFHGAKLYVDGDLRDVDSSLIATGKTALLSANLGELGILEVFPSALISVEMDAYVSKGDDRARVYSSHQRLNLKEQRLRQ